MSTAVPPSRPQAPVAPEDAFEAAAPTAAAELSMHLRIWSRSGLYDRKGLLSIADDFTELPPAVRRRLVDIALRSAQVRFAEVERPTDAERLVSALRGIPGVAASFFGAQTQHEAFDRCAARAKAQGNDPEGLVVLTLHGLSIATAGGGVNLHFAARPGEDPTRVGQLVQAALLAADLPVFWSGASHDVLYVHVRWLLPPGFLADELSVEPSTT